MVGEGAPSGGNSVGANWTVCADGSKKDGGNVCVSEVTKYSV